jgi:hypothetical protein
MSVKHETLTVGTTPTALTTNRPDTSGNNYEVARSVVISNEGAVSVFIGGAGVTSTDYGFRLSAGATLAFDLIRSDSPMAVVASGTAVVRVLHLGV